jgi:hypothetical protein
MIKLRYLLIAVYFCCAIACLRRQVVPAWGGGADERDLSFGFSFQYVSTYFKIDKEARLAFPFMRYRRLKANRLYKKHRLKKFAGFWHWFYYPLPANRSPGGADNTHRWFLPTGY